MKKKDFNIRRFILDYFLITIGSAVFALAFNMFMKPYEIVPGGVTGIAMIINYLVNALPVGTLAIVINIPLFVVSWRKFGGQFLIKSMYGTFISSLLIDLTAGLGLGRFETEPLLAAVYGGVLSGAGLGLVFSAGATTGGTDIAARLLKTVVRHMPIGRLLLMVDLFVIIAAAIVFNSLNSALYAIITLFISTKVIDAILYGMDFAKVAYIISDLPDEIIEAVSKHLGRGATYLYGEGAHTGERKKVILCAIKRQQIAELKDIVKNTDRQAFIILTEAHEVLGDGFSDYSCLP